MSRIKIVLSDLHIGGGLYSQDGSRNPYEDFWHDHKLVEFLEYHRTGEYLDDEVEIILNGDCFEMLQTGPEEGSPGIITEKIAGEKMQRIINAHPRIFDALAQFCRFEGKSVAVIIGNHDIPLIWKGVQDLLKARISEDLMFYTDGYRFDDVWIEHGHQLDASCRREANKYFLTKGLEEPILNLTWSDYFIIDYMNKMKPKRPYLDKVKPFSRYLRWAFFFDFFFIVSLWFRLMIFFFAGFFRRKPQRRTRLIDVWTAVTWPFKYPTYEVVSLQIMKREKVNVVVIGHTHNYRSLTFAGGRQYLNTGTWVEITNLDLSGMGSVFIHTYVQLEQTGRRWKGTLMEWKGRYRVSEKVAF